MTRIEVVRNDAGQVVRIQATGHAQFATRGNDIVCAGVSVLLQTAILGITSVAKAEHKACRKDGELALEVTPTKETDAIIETMILGIKDLERQYPKHIKIKEA